ncbi:membrane protein [Pseudoclavibacter endophyticus]|uniref:HlyC/CorC family transporter n=1 Tax=Pseudoclavibacter endophyticus TaxID=1778590 RepID=A0A6H9WG31_9MICO|nr:hemolysin family protein [Pseudoclavibacter endophyticus]KAB1649862.1 HlyC/CorC family transporter [Pseudoclavibacter endophyticus]GGA59193.1 membrane protein [Pseudoclavibacter endophyticus]
MAETGGFEEYWVGIVWLVVLLLGNAFFVGAEFAVISARRSQIEPRAERGERAAKTTLFAMEHATLMLATSQLGITVCSLLILNVSEPAIHHLLEIPLGLTGLSAEMISGIAFVIALIVVTYLHVVLGEMVPKNISFSVPDRAALILAPPLVFVSRVFAPVIWLMNAIANSVLRVFGVEPKAEATSAYTFDQVAGIVEQSKREGLLKDVTGTLTNAFEFTAKRVGEVAVPVEELRTLPPGATPADLQRAVAAYGFSRYLIEGDDGALQGYVHLKDVLDLEGDAYEQPIPPERIRPQISFYVGTALEDALGGMRSLHAHVAPVFDARGRVAGVLFLEDIIEELVGEIRDASVRETWN